MTTAKRKSPAKHHPSSVKSIPAVKSSSAKRTKRTAGKSLVNGQAQADRVVAHLRADYPDVTCALENETPFELLVATILSAQCTDARVNMVTPVLFLRWPDAEAMSTAPLTALAKHI